MTAIAPRVLLVTALLACLLAGCGAGPEESTGPAEELVEVPMEEPAEEPWGNPIDRWHQEMAAEYGNSHTDGFLNSLYGDAWQAELEEFLETAYPDAEDAARYREAVAQAAEARRGLQDAEETEAGWTTGSSGRVTMAGAEVYRQAFLSFAETRRDRYPYLFDAETYTAAFLEGLEN